MDYTTAAPGSVPGTVSLDSIIEAVEELRDSSPRIVALMGTLETLARLAAHHGVLLKSASIDLIVGHYVKPGFVVPVYRKSDGTQDYGPYVDVSGVPNESEA